MAPTDISPDGHEVWDWANRLSERVQAVAELKRLRIQVHNERTVCGSCAIWMTRSCPREVHDNMRGRSQGPSCMSIKCAHFQMTTDAAKRIDEGQAEIDALQGILTRA